jgi:hypothetical protein
MAFDTQTHATLIKALGIEALPEKDQALVLERSGAMVYQSVVTRALEEMDPEAVDGFEQIVNGDEVTPEKVLTYFRTVIPNFDAMIDEEARQFLARGQSAE